MKKLGERNLEDFKKELESRRASSRLAKEEKAIAEERYDNAGPEEVEDAKRSLTFANLKADVANQAYKKTVELRDLMRDLIAKVKKLKPTA